MTPILLAALLFVSVVDGGEAFRVEVQDLLDLDAALAVADADSAAWPSGTLTVLPADAPGFTVPLVWDTVAACLAAEFPAEGAPLQFMAEVRGGVAALAAGAKSAAGWGESVWLPAEGLMEFPELSEGR